MERTPTRDCYVYIDAAYVQERLREAGAPVEFDPRRCVTAFQTAVRVGGHDIWPTRYFYYDAVDNEDATAGARRAHLERLAGLDDVHVAAGRVERAPDDQRRRQVGVDVRLATDALEAASRRVVSAIALATGDADFVPLVRAIRRAGPHVFVLAFAGAKGLSRQLRREADRVLTLAEPNSGWGLDT